MPTPYKEHTVQVSDAIMEETNCVSRFFQETLHFSKSPNEIRRISQKSVDTSLDFSQSSTNSEELNLSQLTIEEPVPLDISPFYNITPRQMPESPHYVIEEAFRSNPWALLVGTVFLTKTTAKQARPYIKTFFEEYPTPYEVLNDTPDSLERFFQTLGLKRRGPMIWRLSYQFVSARWRRASDLCGIGKYGEDAYRIFCLGHTDLDPGDRYLKLYVNWLRNHTGFLEDNGVVDCECVIEDPVLNYYSITLRDGN